jgi:uncharacterized membrane protein
MPAQIAPRPRAVPQSRRRSAHDDGQFPPRWPAKVGLTLCAFGLSVAGYLTFEHYTSSTSLACPAGSGEVNCLKVTTSAYAMIHGTPVADLGLVYFAIMALFQVPAAWRSNHGPIRVARIVWATIGVTTALWLVYAELFKVNSICLWCTAVHLLTLLLFAATIFATASTGRDSNPSPKIPER